MEDYIDEGLRAELNQMSLAWAQNFKETGFGPVEWLDTKMARTVTELQRNLKETFQLKEIKAEKQRQEDMAFPTAKPTTTTSGASSRQTSRPRIFYAKGTNPSAAEYSEKSN
jgi:hypothetical protein